MAVAIAVVRQPRFESFMLQKPFNQTVQYRYKSGLVLSNQNCTIGFGIGAEVRVTTDERRNAIIEAAKTVFREDGYERASMTAIAARVGGSKATLYGYFKSKEQLFVAAMLEAVQEQGQVVIDLLDPSEPRIELVLQRFGEAYLEFMMTPGALTVMRAAVAEGTHVASGARLYENGPKRGWEGMKSYFARLREQGAIRAVDPGIAAGHFKGMLEAGIIEPLLFGAKPELDPKRAAAAAVDAFLCAYGEQEDGRAAAGGGSRR